MKINREKIKAMFGGKCAYCGEVLNDKWHVDHVEPLIRMPDNIEIIEKGDEIKVKTVKRCHNPENHREDNLFPACISCNIHKGASTVEGFRWTLQSHIQMLNEKTSNYSIYRHAKRFGLVKETPKEIVFWFEAYKKEVSDDNL